MQSSDSSLVYLDGDRPRGSAPRTRSLAGCSSSYGTITTSPSITGPEDEWTSSPVGVRTVIETVSRPEPAGPPSTAWPTTM